MQHFIRRKNIENLTKQLASGRLDEAQRRYAQQKLAEELAQDRVEAGMVAARLDGEAGGTEASC